MKNEPTLVNGSQHPEGVALRAQLEAVVNQMPGGVIVAEAPSGRIMFGNAQMERILGHPLLVTDDVKGYANYGAEHPDGRRFAPEEHPLAQAVAGQSVEGAEVRYRRPNGTLRILSANAAPILDGNGAIQAGIVTFFDVTEQWRAERSLELLAEASGVLASSLDAEETLHNVVYLAVPRLADFCTVYLRNDSSLRRAHLAHARSELTPLLDAIWDRRIDIVEGSHPARTVVETGNSVHLPQITDELLQRTATDDEHLANLRRLSVRCAFIAPLVGRAEVLGALGFGMTERGRSFDELTRRTAEELGRRAGIALHNARLYRSAQQAVRGRERVLSVVSHDLRNPLNVVALTAKVLMQRADHAGDRGLESNAMTLQNAALRMERLIDDLLDLANVDAGRLGVSLQMESIAEILTEAFTTHMELAARIGRRIDVEVAPELETLQLPCDRNRMLQALGNLIDNALIHAPEESTVCIRGERVDGSIMLSVRDAGPGIPLAEQPHIFAPFWGKQRGRQRAGLGLSITKGIIEAHGGRVWVESTPGAGSKFVVALPLTPPSP